MEMAPTACSAGLNPYARSLQLTSEYYIILRLFYVGSWKEQYEILTSAVFVFLLHYSTGWNALCTSYLVFKRWARACLNFCVCNYFKLFSGRRSIIFQPRNMWENIRHLRWQTANTWWPLVLWYWFPIVCLILYHFHCWLPIYVLTLHDSSA